MSCKSQVQHTDQGTLISCKSQVQHTDRGTYCRILPYKYPRMLKRRGLRLERTHSHSTLVWSHLFLQNPLHIANLAVGGVGPSASARPLCRYQTVDSSGAAVNLPTRAAADPSCGRPADPSCGRPDVPTRAAADPMSRPEPPHAAAGRPRRTPLETPDFRTQNRAATAPRPRLKQRPCCIRMALEGGPGMTVR